jgi:four helix bundle protein
MPETMGFQKMRAYVLARDFYGVAAQAVPVKNWRDRNLIEQLLRAASSVCLNIAEGAGEYSRDEKIRFYRIARRSAWECSAAVDLLSLSAADDHPAVIAAAPRLNEIAALLTTMIIRRPPSSPR